MHLNPLKKDDNTDALVKALEDANAADGTDQAAAAPDATQTDNSAPAEPADDAAVPADDSKPADEAEPTLPTPDAAPETAETAPADSSASLSLDESNLPGNLSGDADAHLPSVSTGSTSDGALDDVKKSALEQLRPLIEKIDLEPADKFDKYLMMLRASDDPTLIKPAFEAAQGISGEKEKAQALLDIINEINYITANQVAPQQ